MSARLTSGPAEYRGVIAVPSVVMYLRENRDHLIIHRRGQLCDSKQCARQALSKVRKRNDVARSDPESAKAGLKLDE